MNGYPSMTINQKKYYFACKYMALTEIFDRKLTDLRSPYDPTEAFVLNPTARTASALYSQSIISVSYQNQFNCLYKYYGSADDVSGGSVGRKC